jgi:HK97 gp10 family phage protein
MPISLKLNLRTEELKERKAEAVRAAVTEVFEIDIKGRAKELSPVSEDNPQVGTGKYRPTGLNRNSIDTEVEIVPEGVKATLFTQSGYGGYLETGTHLMEARPYLYPAFDEFVGKIPEKTRENLNG